MSALYLSGWMDDVLQSGLEVLGQERLRSRDSTDHNYQITIAGRRVNGTYHV